jgi:hypothetical protein
MSGVGRKTINLTLTACSSSSDGNTCRRNSGGGIGETKNEDMRVPIAINRG